MSISKACRAVYRVLGLVVALAVCDLAQAAVSLTGNQDLYAAVGSYYTYAPTVSGASLNAVFSSTGNPSWLATDVKTGRLSGTPIAADVSKQFRVIIAVSDAGMRAELYVYLHITAAVASSNTAPTITGTPGLTATVGAAYSFAPVGKDANGDALAYSIVNKPIWATFSTVTGALTGTPSAAGSFANIAISVSDGKVKSSLPVFTLTVAALVQKYGVTLSWKAPTSNDDSSALLDLAGYRVMYGTSADKMFTKLEVPSATMTSVRVEELVSGTYFFAVKAYRKDGVESDLTQTVWKTL